MKTIPISSTLYECELWHSMSYSDIQKVEKLWKLCGKKSQHLYSRTRTYMVFSLLCWYNIQCVIDKRKIAKRKIAVLQRLCKMPTNCVTNQIFTYRLNLFKTSQCTRQKGFIPNTFKILKKCGLTVYRHSYLTTSTFPEQST